MAAALARAPSAAAARVGSGAPCHHGNTLACLCPVGNPTRRSSAFVMAELSHPISDELVSRRGSADSTRLVHGLSPSAAAIFVAREDAAANVGECRIGREAHRRRRILTACAAEAEASDGNRTAPEGPCISGQAEVLGELPRRRLQVAFTCDKCGARTTRLVNPDAYKRGTVFVQCAGCEVFHKLVDNLNLIVEYNLLDEIDYPNTEEALQEAQSSREDHGEKDSTT